MIIFLKAQFSSLTATAFDFAFTILFIEIIEFNYMIATSIGAIAGAVTNFGINKFWSFNKSKGVIKKQGLRYAFVWIGSITLNVTGSNLLINVFKMQYVFSKIAIALLVGLTFNYTLQRYYVFRTAKETYKA